jgi:hypothetical protein
MHLMLDFETLGSAADTIVVSLGAVAFNKGGIVNKKLFHFDLEEQARLGRSFTGDTLAWWMRQSQEARAVFNSKETKLPLELFFLEFENFVDDALTRVGEKRDELKPWGKGANFDISILESLYREKHTKFAAGIPWKFWNVWCFRTFAALTGCEKLHARPHGTHHNALEDAEYQARCVLAHWAKVAARKTKKK